MSHFLYFIPGAARASLPRAEVLATFAKTALRDQLRSDKTWSGDAVTYNQLIMGGPGGHIGTIFACLPTGSEFVADYHPDRQTWVQIDNAWLGWETDNPPTEASLRKPAKRIVSGYAVTLNDDCDWIAPTVRCQPKGSRVTLPMAVSLGANGQRTMQVMRHYQHWQDLVDRLWSARFGDINLANTEFLDAAAELLSLNYQIGPKEIDALGLFEVLGEQTPNWFEIIEAAYDWPIVREVMEAEAAKKKSADQPSEQSVG